MSDVKTKSLSALEQKMQGLSSDSLRYQILNHTKHFKTSWVELGQALYSAWKDKLYKEWGFSTFEAYTAKEIGIRSQTALKLLRSYYFLEKEEPRLLRKEYADQAQASSMPTLDSIDTLRLAQKKSLDKEDFLRIKNNVLEKGKDAKEIKKDLTLLMQQRQELEPEEARQKRKLTQLRRLISVLTSLREEIAVAKALPAAMIKEIDKLIRNLTEQMPQP
ncbi:MAG: hypothetical protein V1727_03165 [Candidatus Omnitrophota bacterium]